MKGIRLSPQAIASQLALRKVPSPFGHPSYGRGGRQSNAGITAAVFGNTGFIGKYVMGELGAFHLAVFDLWYTFGIFSYPIFIIAFVIRMYRYSRMQGLCPLQRLRNGRPSLEDFI